jgi:anaerobic ribonucleoside-triphosphate reductase activating protein
MYIDDIKLALDANYKRHRGLTFSGGDPFLQPRECKEVALYAKNVLGLDIWAYCGWTFEQLIEDPDKRELLEVCDVLVDGPYVMSRRDTSLPFRGSSNQRLVDVKQSLKQGKVILYGEYC